ncbi:MAG: hypothetical protein ACREBG_09090, partial [Pyrinomonadaceae bacterium]
VENRDDLTHDQSVLRERIEWTCQGMKIDASDLADLAKKLDLPLMTKDGEEAAIPSPVPVEAGMRVKPAKAPKAPKIKPSTLSDEQVAAAIANG